jgi:predicted molibdopterin-dependent oxidoreductase YjgC
MARSAAGEVGALYLVGQDPVGSWPVAAGGRTRPRADFLIVQDAFLTATAQAADVVLPVALLIERAGTLTGADGVARRLSPSLPAPAGLPGDGDLFAEIANRLQVAVPLGDALARELDALASPAPEAQASFAPVNPPAVLSSVVGTVLDVSPQLFHSGTVTHRSPTLRQLAPAVGLRLSREDARALGAVSGELVRAATATGEMMLRVRVDRTVRSGAAGLAWNGDCAHLVHDDREVAIVEIRRSV